MWSSPAGAQIPYPYMSIQDIQLVDAGDDSSYQAASPNDTIWTTGIVTVGAGELYAGSNITLYLQDIAGGPWSGILLFNSDNSAFNVGRGDSILVIGTIGEYTTSSDSLETGFNIETSMSEIITTSSVLKVGEGIPLPQVIALSPSDLDSLASIERSAEQYEGCLVRVDNVVVTGQVSAYSQFWVSDDGGSSESCVIRLYADSLQTYPKPPAGSIYESITGIIYHVYGNYTILCRKPEDLVLATGAPLIGYSYSPQPPQPEDTVKVEVTIVDDGTITEAILYYQLDGEEFYDAPLEHLGGASYLGRIPPQPVGTVVGFYITATDNVGNTSYEPENAPTQVVTYTVVQSVPATIYDVQYTTDPGLDSTYPSLILGSLVTVTGVITADHSVSSSHLYIQDDTDPQGTGGAWNGVYLYDAGNYSPAIGDKIQLTAEVYEYYGKTELQNIASYTLISSGNDLPPAVELQTADILLHSKVGEPYEGVFVKVSDISVVSAPDANGNWHIDDGSGPAQVDGGYYSYEPQLNDHIDWILGFIDYAYDEYEIEIRTDDDIGPVTPTSVPAVCEQLPRTFAMSQNYPNPFNPITRFTYTVPRQSPVKIEIFNIMGQRVRVLVDEKVAAGSHVVTWNGQSDARMEAASGIYFCRFQAGDFCQIRKLVLLK
jgi:hypothetical protein